MKVFLCRHGQTDHNKDDIVQGQMDTCINDKGRKQAEKLAERLEEESIDQVYSSSMERAEETSKIVSERIGVSFDSSDGLKEISRAHFEGEDFEDLVDEITSSDVEDYLLSPEGGETRRVEREKHQVLQ